MNSTALFIADLHLEPKPGGTYDLALQFLQQAKRASSLYILGDLFEYWIGDDVGIDLYRPVITALRELADSGCQITFMHGNRDFLIGDEFAKQCAVTLINDDELLIELDGQNILLMHGDTLCTDDNEYQRFREMVRAEQWQTEFLALDPDERIARATQLRNTSRSASASKQQSIMDVNHTQANLRMQAHDCQLLIHGHTHRPDVHQLEAGAGSRYVVGDWHADHAQVVEFSEGQLQLINYMP